MQHLLLLVPTLINSRKKPDSLINLWKTLNFSHGNSKLFAFFFASPFAPVSSPFHNKGGKVSPTKTDKISLLTSFTDGLLGALRGVLGHKPLKESGDRFLRYHKIFVVF